MTDFLTRMAQLSRGEAAVMAPRLPGLFAPAPAAEFDETAVAPMTQPARDTETPEPAAQASAETADAKAFPPPTPSREPASAALVHNKPSAGQATKTEVVLTPLVAPAETNPAQQDSYSPLALSPRIARETRQQEPHHHHSETPLLVNQPPPSATSQTFSAPFDLAAPAAAFTDGTLPRQSTPLVQGYKNRQPTPPQAMAELTTNTEPATKQEPAVHINIGRIEVRAQTAAPSAPTRPAQPKTDSRLSLNDYLKRGGGRP